MPDNKIWGKKASVIHLIFLIMLLTPFSLLATDPPLDETPAEGREWGFYPNDDEPLQRNPPSFTWRPQSEVQTYTLQVASDPEFQNIFYERDDLTMNVHTPPVTFDPGESYWRFRYKDSEYNHSQWSQIRKFVILPDAMEFPLPEIDELISRIPGEHPRLFIRPEDVSHLRELARGELHSIYEALVDTADKLIASPLSTEEPPRYPEHLKRGTDGWLSDEWREIWWGNRLATLELLDGAATLGFVYLLGGDEKYGQEARRILMKAAEWDPLGATGYLYNTEAGMPYISRFSRTYTFVNDLLTEEEKQICREMMQARGEELYHHLYPDHLWDPYQSHSNRAWHFLGEAAVAFIDEIPEAENWLWFAMNVFTNVYPVWSDSDGGWFEGLSYWQSYLQRFTWWADIMNTAMSVNAFDMPYFAQAGYFPMYVHPPGTPGGGFGDHAHSRSSQGSVPLMRILAAQASNPHWQWFVDQHGDQEEVEATYVSFIRGSRPAIEATPPEDLPASRLFRGIGQAMLNTTLLNADDNVQVLFKSSPMGVFSHGNEAQNSFMLYAYGERLFLSSGQYRTYGSDHHRYWIMHTKAHNSITVGGESQVRGPESAGEITGFYTSDHFDVVSGEAGEAYGELLDSFERSIIFLRPSLVVLVDRLAAPEEELYEFRLHSMTSFMIENQTDIFVETGRAASSVSFHAPEALNISQTDQFDTPVEEGVDLTQYHLTAATSTPAEEMLFITSLRPQQSNEDRLSEVTSEKVAGGYLLKADIPDGKAIILVRDTDAAEVAGDGFVTNDKIAVIKLNSEGEVIEKYAPDRPVQRK
jgi:hypothetical protein